MVKAMDKMRYPRKKGYAGRYVRHELGKNKLNLLLGCVFLLGALVGCQLAGQDPETILSQLGSLFSATGQSAGFLDTVVAYFAANAVLLLILCLCGLGAVFQPLALGVLFWRGLGLGVLGVYSYSAGERAAVLYYLLVLLPQALLPSTTALGTALPDGREQGILHGANVVMPNLTPPAERAHYLLYHDKLSAGAESAAGLDELRRRLGAIGYEADIENRGDSPLKL